MDTTIAQGLQERLAVTDDQHQCPDIVGTKPVEENITESNHLQVRAASRASGDVALVDDGIMVENRAGSTAEMLVKIFGSD